MATNYTEKPRKNENPERFIKRFIKKCKKLGILDEMKEISKWLTSPDAAPEDAEFDYNGFFEGVMKRLEEYGVYRDIAGEIDAADADDDEERSFPSTRQMDLPLQESRIIQRWSKIIK